MTVKLNLKKILARWAATPRFRFHLHKEVEEKLVAMARHEPTQPLRLNPEAKAPQAIISSGVAAAHTREVLQELGLWQKIPFYQVLQPFPLHSDFITHWIESYEEILVIEETMGVIEMQLADRHRVKGRVSGTCTRPLESFIPRISWTSSPSSAGSNPKSVQKFPL